MSQIKLKILSILGIVQFLLGAVLLFLIILRMQFMRNGLAIFAFIMLAIYLINSGWVSYKKKEEGRIISFYNFISFSIVLAISLFIQHSFNSSLIVRVFFLVISVLIAFYLFKIPKI